MPKLHYAREWILIISSLNLSNDSNTIHSYFQMTAKENVCENVKEKIELIKMYSFASICQKKSFKDVYVHYVQTQYVILVWVHSCTNMITY